MKVVPESRNLVSWSLALAAVLAMLSAQADTWRLNAGTPSSGAAFSTDASYWTSDTTHEKGSGNLNPNDDYIVSGYQLRAKNTFGGGSLAIGDLTDPDYASCICMDYNLTINVPLTLNTGYIYINTYSSSYVSKMGTYTIAAPKTEVTAPADKPFGFYASYAWRTMKLTALSGAEGTGIVVGGTYSSKGLSCDSVAKSNFVFYVVDASAYKGNIKVISNGTLAPNGWDAALKLGTAEIGTLDVSAGSEFQGESGASELTVSSLTLHAGSRLRAAWDGTAYTASVIRVTSAFEIPEEEGVVEVVFSSKPTVREAPTILPLLVVPDTQELDLARFVARDIGDADAQPRLSVVHDEEAHTKSLVATIYAKLKLVTADSTEYASNGANYTSALSEGHEAQWSDNKLPHDLAIYEMGQQSGYGNCLRTCEFKSTDDYVFKGELLRTMGSQAFFVFAGSHAFEANIEVTAKTFFRVYNGYDPVLRGRLALNANAQSLAYNGSILTVKSAISGTGNWTIEGRNGTGSPQGTVAFEGDNSGWTGAISMTQNSGTGKNGSAYPCYDTYHQNLRFSDAKNLGGPLDEFNYKALSLNHYSAVLVTNTVALSKDTNRGIYVTNAAIFNVSADCTFDCGWPVTFAGTLYKTGAGTVGFGGVKFRDATGALTDEIPEKAEHRLLVVTNGCVKALSHDCLDGITVDLRKPTSTISTALAVAFNPEDANIKRYGFYNVKTTTPFVEGHAINFRILNVDTVALEAARLTDEGYKQGLITVKTTAAKNVADNLVVEKVKGLRLIREDDAETKTTTFSLYGKKEGILLIVR